MAVTTLDPDCALIVIDLQMGLLATPTLQPIAQVVAHASELAGAFRRRALPVVLVNAQAVRPAVDQPAHDHAVGRIFPRIAETGSTADVLALLATHGA